ncbi:MAG: hypothetical protein EP343_13390 [Deltaproteobacteria bacterium]|nr:MAG: hypothetical protein EP343_13390 [Deltaproteobacteria bacterium]
MQNTQAHSSSNPNVTALDGAPQNASSSLGQEDFLRLFREHLQSLEAEEARRQTFPEESFESPFEEKEALPWLQSMEWKEHVGLETETITQELHLLIRKCHFKGFFLRKVQAPQLHLTFEDCSFEGPLHLGNASSRETAWGSTFGSITFKNSTCKENIRFNGSTFEQVHFAEDSTVGGVLQLNETTIAKSLTVEDSEVNSIDLANTTLQGCIDFRNLTCQTIHADRMAGSNPSQPVRFTLQNVRKLARLSLKSVQMPNLSLYISGSQLDELVLGNEGNEKTRGSHVGSLVFQESSCRQSLVLSGSVFAGPVSITNCGQLPNLEIKGSTLHGLFTFSDCQDVKDLLWSGTNFRGGVHCKTVTCRRWNAEAAKFGMNPNEDFEKAQSTRLSFARLHCQGEVNNNSSHFFQDADFDRCSFQSLCSFESATFHKACDFGKVMSYHQDHRNQFHDHANFQGATFQQATFSGSMFRRDVSFSNATFGKASSRHRHDFRNIECYGQARFEEIVLHSSLNFDTAGTNQVDMTRFHGPTLFSVASVQSIHPLELRFVAARFLKQVTFKTNAFRLRLNCLRSVLHNPTFASSFNTIYLTKAEIIGSDDEDKHVAFPALRSCRKLLLDKATLHNVRFEFDAEAEQPLRELTIHARRANFKNVLFTGTFAGYWRMVGCTLEDVRFAELELHSSLNLSQSKVTSSSQTDAFFENVHFFDRKKRTPRLNLSQCPALLKLTFRHCTLPIMDLRGSYLQQCTLFDGKCQKLLLRRGIQGRNLLLSLHPSVQTLLEPQVPEHTSLEEWLNRELTALLEQSHLSRTSTSASPELKENSIRIELEETPIHQADLSVPEMPLTPPPTDPNNSMDADEESEEPNHEDELEFDRFRVVYLQENDDQEYDDSFVAEFDLSRHSKGPVMYLKRQLQRFYRSAELLQLHVEDFEIRGSDDKETPHAKPRFVDTTLEGATIRGSLFRCAILEGTFHTSAACTFDHLSLSHSEVRGPFHLVDSKVVGRLDAAETHFFENVSFTRLRAEGELAFTKAMFRKSLQLSHNRVDGCWRFDGANFAAPVSIEDENSAGLLSCQRSELNQTFVVQNSRFGKGVDLSGSVFFGEVHWKSLTAQKLSATRFTAQFKAPVSIRNSEFTEGLTFKGAIFSDALRLDTVKADVMMTFYRCEFGGEVKFKKAHGSATLGFGQSNFAERLVLEDAEAVESLVFGMAEFHAPVIIRGKTSSRPDTSQNPLKQRLETIDFSGTRSATDVHLSNLTLKKEINFDNSRFSNDLSLQNVTFEQEPSELHFSGVEVHNRLVLQDIHNCQVSFENVKVLKELDVRGFDANSPLKCSLGQAFLADIGLPVNASSALQFEPMRPTPQRSDLGHDIQEALHDSQLHRVCEQQHRYQEAREFGFRYRQALRKLPFRSRRRFFLEKKTKAEGTTRFLHRLFAWWEALKIQWGKAYNNYGKSPWKIWIWIAFCSALSVVYFQDRGDWSQVGLALADAVLTPIGVLIPAIGVLPFNTSFDHYPFYVFFGIQSALIGVMLFNFVALLVPNLIKKEKLSQLLIRSNRK